MKKSHDIRKMTSREKVIMVVIVVVCIALFYNFLNVCFNYPEKIMTTKKYHLMIALNNGEKDAEIYYMNKYILNDDYLYDGPVTLKLVAQKYNLNEGELTELWDNGDYKSMKQFVKKVVKPMVKEAELNYIAH